MAYTNHGWHISNSSETPKPEFDAVNCGGPTLCSTCALDVVHFLSKGTVDMERIEVTANSKDISLKTNIYQRKSFDVEAVQVTEENLEQVAAWCGGSIVTVHETHEDALIQLPPKRYISVPVVRPLSRRQTEAYIGDWVLYASKSFKVYGNRPFNKSFEEKSEELLVTAVPAGDDE